MSMMNNSLKNNRALLKKKWGVNLKKEYANYAAKNKTILTFKEATEEDLIKIRKELKRQGLINRWKSLVALVFALALTGFAFYTMKQLY